MLVVGLEKAFSGLKPLSRGQRRLKDALLSEDYEVVGVFGPTGTGKSLFSLLYGLEAVARGKYKRLVVSRPVVDVVSGREYTVADIGELYEQMASSYLRDIVTGFLDWDDVSPLIAKGMVASADTHYLRGRTFDDSVIVLDDAQSVPPESVVEVMMRIGRNSRLIVAGDPVFQRTTQGSDASVLVREVLVGEERAEVVDLGLKDIVRPGARRGIRLLLETRMRRRGLGEAERSVLEAARIYAPDADVITVAEFVEEKKRYGVEAEHVPDALVVVKEGSMGRLVGRGGERIARMEEDTGLRIRGMELTLDFTG
ncbi:MAG: PhoH family protein, partial [Candidatus Korarchaeota archaeon]|nr:PhoH family protein [Candidatus Korarchaeota archaeon]